MSLRHDLDGYPDVFIEHLGTFNGLDGEMIILDGRCYHLHADGKVTTATDTDTDRTPFAAVTHFKPEITIPGLSPATRPEVTSL